MPDINGIPTAGEFKTQLSRGVCLARVTKKSDQIIDDILVLLRPLENLRGDTTAACFGPLRAVRKRCIEWMLEPGNTPEQRKAYTKIRGLCDAVHIRYMTVVEHNFGQTEEGLQTTENRGMMARVHDEIRLRRGRGVGRSLDDHYAIERSSNTHIPRPGGSEAHAFYRRVREMGHTRLGFDDWVRYVLVPDSEDDPFQIYFSHGMIVQGPNLQNLQTRTVQYCNPTERDSYKLTLGNNIRTASGEVFSTAEMSTAFSGRGWAIYVIDFDQNFYSNSHVINQFHHSSFLAGAPVLAAGELAVDAGRIVALTNKTGHYKAGARELASALGILEASGVVLATLKVSDPFRSKGKWYTGSKALEVQGAVDTLTLADEVEPPARVTA